MSHEYQLFKWIITQIDQGCPSLDGYEDFLPRIGAADYCTHFASEEQYMEKALICLDELATLEPTVEMIAKKNSMAANYARRLIEQAKAANRDEIVALLREDWAARCVKCAA